MSDLLYYSVFSRPEKVSMAKAIILWAGIKVPQPRAVAKQYWKDCPLYELDTIWDFFLCWCRNYSKTKIMSSAPIFNLAYTD